MISQLCLSGKTLGLLVGPLQPVSHLVHEPHKPLLYSYLAIPPTLTVVAGINHTESNPTLLSLSHLSQNKSMALSKRKSQETHVADGRKRGLETSACKVSIS